jgi:hypothetical protein
MVRTVGLNRVRVIYRRIRISPYFRVLAIVNLLSLREHNLMRNGVLLIRQIVILERIFSILNPQLLGDFYIETSFFAIHISILLRLEGLRVEWLENRQPLDHEFIGQLQSIMANDRFLPHLHVAVVKG